MNQGGNTDRESVGDGENTKYVVYVFRTHFVTHLSHNYLLILKQIKNVKHPDNQT